MAMKIFSPVIFSVLVLLTWPSHGGRDVDRGDDHTMSTEESDDDAHRDWLENRCPLLANSDELQIFLERIRYAQMDLSFTRQMFLFDDAVWFVEPSLQKSFAKIERRLHKTKKAKNELISFKDFKFVVDGTSSFKLRCFYKFAGGKKFHITTFVDGMVEF